MMKGQKYLSRSEGYPNSDAIMERGVLLPLHHGMTEKMFNRFFDVVDKFIENL